jgi:hypothetical protein
LILQETQFFLWYHQVFSSINWWICWSALL